MPHRSFYAAMTPPTSLTGSADNSLRQAVRLPRESDGVGNALRNIFGATSGLPAEFRALLGQLSKDD